MRLDDFRTLVHRLARELPAEFLEGVVDVTVSRVTLPHPTRAGIYTLGECIPMPGTEEAGRHGIQSRVVLYHGSFAALARDHEDFDWRKEAWDTLTHELRHHLEWRARAPDLEDFDWAAEQNFARQDGEPFDPTFYRAGEQVAAGVYRIDEDFFLEQILRRLPPRVEFQWHGARYTAPVPASLRLPLFLVVDRVAVPPPGELVVVFRRRLGLIDLLRRAGTPSLATVDATPA